MNLKNFFAELKRRNVYKVSVAYAIGPLPLTRALLRLDPMFDPLRNLTSKYVERRLGGASAPKE